ncbi:MAG TPA: hypothetical protein VIG99_03030, partial [Myxococcaceae bacterium]|jgi:hypothetical protein
VSFAAVHATDLSRVVSTFAEGGDRFSASIDLGLERTQRLESIGRERHTGPPDSTLEVAPELRYASVDYRLNLDLHIGLWHDLEFHYGIPLIFARTEEWWLSSLTTPSRSAVLNSCVRADGSLVNSNCSTTGVGAVPMFSAPIATTNGAPQVFRGGFGNMHFGLSWAPYSHVRDGVWVVGLEYEAPTADRLDPTDPADDAFHGAIGDRIHRYQLWTAFSRRINSITPYAKIDWTIPYRGPGWYSNCDHPDPTLMGRPANCNSTAWNRDVTGDLPPYTAEITAGAELVVLDQPAQHERLTIDARAHIAYVSSGRYYNELSGLTKKLMYTGDYGQLGGTVGIQWSILENLQLRARVTLSHESDRVLSNEPPGQDLNNNGVIDYQTNQAEVNPNFDYRYDMVARHFYATAVYVSGVQVSVSYHY